MFKYKKNWTLCHHSCLTIYFMQKPAQNTLRKRGRFKHITFSFLCLVCSDCGCVHNLYRGAHLQKAILPIESEICKDDHKSKKKKYHI